MLPSPSTGSSFPSLVPRKLLPRSCRPLLRPQPLPATATTSVTSTTQATAMVLAHQPSQVLLPPAHLLPSPLDHTTPPTLPTHPIPLTRKTLRTTATETSKTVKRTRSPRMTRTRNGSVKRRKSMVMMRLPISPSTTTLPNVNRSLHSTPPTSMPPLLN